MRLLAPGKQPTLNEPRKLFNYILIIKLIHFGKNFYFYNFMS